MMYPKTAATEGKTDLMVAVNNNDIQAVRQMVEDYPEQLHQKDSFGLDALLHCSASGCIEIFQYLVQKGMNTKITSTIRSTCLMFATENNKVDLVKYLVENYPEQIPIKDDDDSDALLHCCVGGSIEIFQFLVQKGMDTSTTSTTGKTCLMIAARNSQVHLVKYLVEKYPEQVSIKDDNGWNALLNCCIGESIEIFQYLVQKGMDTSTTSTTGETCLMIAAWNNKVHLVKYLVEKYPEQVSIKDDNGWNALLNCCIGESIEIFQYLVQKGMDTSTTSTTGETCLMIAARNSQVHLVKYLVEKYPEQVPIKDGNGWNALLKCCIGKSIEIFQYLVQKGMDTSTTSTTGKTCLMIAAQNSQVHLVKYLVEKYPEQVHIKDDNEWNALLNCCIGESIEIFQYLVQKGMYTSMRSFAGQTCLMIAASNNKVHLVKYLVDNYPEQVPIRDCYGRNALLNCCIGGTIEIFQYLVQKGMDTSTTSTIGQTCLMIAAWNNKVHLVKYLVDNYPEQVPIKNHFGKNALLHCCIGGTIAIFQYLVQKGMDTSTTSTTGQTCLMIAARNSQVHLVKYLVEKYPEQVPNKDENGWNALLHCCICGSFEIFQYLVQKGMDTKSTASTGQMCLMIALANNNVGLLEYIACKYTEQILDSKNVFGDNVLSLCCKSGSVKSFQIVVKHLPMFENDFNRYLQALKIIFAYNDDLSMYIVNTYKTQMKLLSWNPFPVVCGRGNLKVFDSLISLGFDPNIPDQENGRTCLMYAAAGGHDVIVQRIFKIPSLDINATDNNGCTALHYCKSKGTTWEDLIKAGLLPHSKNKSGRTALQQVRNSGMQSNVNPLHQLLSVSSDVASTASNEHAQVSLEEYLSLFVGETEDYHHIRVVFLGPEGAGKTTTCQRLQRMPVDVLHRFPTKGGNIYQQLFRIGNTKEWTKLETTTPYGVAKERLDHLLKAKQRQETIYGEEFHDTVGIPTLLKQGLRHRYQEEDLVNRENTNVPDRNTDHQMTNKEADGHTANIQNQPTSSVSGTTTNQPQYPLSALATDVKTMDSSELFALLSLWDMGGHFALLPLVHVFISAHGVYILTINVMACLQDQQELEKLRNWIRIVGSASYYYTPNNRHQQHPPIIIVGTHMDQMKKKYKDPLERDKVIRRLEASLFKIPELSKDYTNVKYEFLHFITVDNSLEDDPGFEIIKGLIIDAAKFQDQWNRDIPATWIMLEREILQLKQTVPALSFRKVVEINGLCEKPIRDEENIRLFLGFLDCIRSVIYLAEFDKVIINPQWLLNAFSLIITDNKFMPSQTDIKLKKDLKLYQEKGLLSPELVLELFTCSGNQTYIDHMDIILKHLTRFGLIVQTFKELCNGNPVYHDTYVVPSKLEKLTDSRKVEVVTGNARILTKTLCVVFIKNFMPLETFDKIYAGVLHEYAPLCLTTDVRQNTYLDWISQYILGFLKSAEDENEIKSIYRNFGCFAIDESTNMIFSMHWEISTIAITLFSDIDDNIPRVVSQSIRRRIDHIIKSTLSVCKQDNLTYQYKLHCSYRLDAEDRPRNGTAILDTEAGVQCLGRKCRGTHNLRREDWDFWLADVADTPVKQDSVNELEIRRIHAEMLRRLSTYITPNLPAYWRTFQTLISVHLSYVEIYGTQVTGVYDICRTLMDRKIIDYGKYEELRSAVVSIHVEAAKIIDDATTAINDIKLRDE